MASRTVDIGNIMIRLNGKCQVCGRRSDTVIVSNIEVCGSCLHTHMSKTIEQREKKRAKMVAEAMSTIIGTKHKILGSIIKTRGAVKILSIILFGRKV